MCIYTCIIICVLYYTVLTCIMLYMLNHLNYNMLAILSMRLSSGMQNIQNTPGLIKFAGNVLRSRIYRFRAKGDRVGAGLLADGQWRLFLAAVQGIANQSSHT